MNAKKALKTKMILDHVNGKTEEVQEEKEEKVDDTKISKKAKVIVFLLTVPVAIAFIAVHEAFKVSPEAGALAIMSALQIGFSSLMFIIPLCVAWWIGTEIRKWLNRAEKTYTEKEEGK